MDNIRLALQGYNFGDAYIPWAIAKDGRYTYSNASEFSNIQAKKLGWKSYGDKNYVEHVLTCREQEIPHLYRWWMNCDKHGIYLYVTLRYNVISLK